MKSNSDMSIPSSTALILHIAHQDAWEEAEQDGWYCPASLPAEGFIHCSTAEQLIEVANRFYRGQTGLILLTIDASRVQAPIRYESPINPDGSAPTATTALFPHIYGPLNADAVVAVDPFPPDGDGLFRLPAEGFKCS